MPPIRAFFFALPALESIEVAEAAVADSEPDEKISEATGVETYVAKRVVVRSWPLVEKTEGTCDTIVFSVSAEVADVTVLTRSVAIDVEKGAALEVDTEAAGVETTGSVEVNVVVVEADVLMMVVVCP